MNILKSDLKFTIEVYPHGWMLCPPDGRGGIPFSALNDCLPLFGRGAVMDSGIAGALGGVCAIGAPAACKKWCAEITDMLDKMPISKPLKWIRGVDCGLSSGTMFWKLTDGQVRNECADRFRWFSKEPDYLPADAEDFGRCLRMVDYLGWHDRLNEARAISKEWDGLINIWSNVRALGIAGKTHELNTLLKSIKHN